MKSSDRERQRLNRMYGYLYNKVNYNKDICYYCNEEASGFDHVPPITSIEYLNLNEFIKEGNRFLLYPACYECNKILYDYNEIDVSFRILKIINNIEKKVKNTTKWTVEELNELGKNLRNYIVNRQNSNKRLKNKLLRLYRRFKALNGLV